MKISAVTTYIAGNAWKNWVFSRVNTDEGVNGIGEATRNGFARTVAMAIEDLKPLVLGRDPFDVEYHTLRLLRDVYSDGGQIQGAWLTPPTLHRPSILSQRCATPFAPRSISWLRAT